MVVCAARKLRCGMCDIYMAKCPRCDVQTDMHLEDYNTGRDEVEVYCGRHLPDDMSDGVLWEYAAQGGWRKVFVRALTRNAAENMDGNCPNEFHARKVACPNGLMAIRRERTLPRRGAGAKSAAGKGRASRKGKVER